MSKCNNCYHNKVCVDGANFKSADNCRQYKDKSLIAELTCNPGDTLFTIEHHYDYDYDSDSSYIVKIKCNGIGIYDCGISIYCKTIVGNCDTYVPEDFGESVFLSREEAERALEECEKNG